MEKHELSVFERLYKNIESECRRNNKNIDEFVNFINEQRNILHGNTLKKIVIDELNNLAKKVESINVNGPKDNKPQRATIMIFPLSKTNKQLPSEMSKVIEEYKKREYFDERLFFLVTNRHKILGYVGLSINEEPLPIGTYIYAYAYKLDTSYDNPMNVNYILNYIENLAKRENIFNIDISSEVMNIDKGVLKNRGYVNFGLTGVIKIKKSDMNRSTHIKVDEEEDYSILDLKEYLPIERTKSISEIVYDKKGLEIKKIIYESGSRIETVYITLLLDTNNAKVHCNIFFTPLCLYDETMLINCINDIISYLINEKKYDLIIGLPMDVISSFDNIDHEYLREVYWYRKGLTYIKK